MDFLENIWPPPQEVNLIKASGFNIPQQVLLKGMFSEEFAQEFSSQSNILYTSADSDIFPVEMKIDTTLEKREYYTLEINEHGILITGSDDAGVYYGQQTLLQIVFNAGRTKFWPSLIIKDYPAYSKRGFMVDMGRSIFSIEMLKLIVKILARLKMNQLHLHLYDDELCGIKFDGHKFGTDNPFAISIKELEKLVKFAAKYHVEIVPELESWAHIGALIYHRPELRGGSGVYNGFSFLFCKKTFELMKDLIGQVVKAMPSKATIHLGLDEAKFFVGDDMPKGFTPEKMVRWYYDILQEIGAEQNKELRMRIWADHEGRPIPKEIEKNVIVEPWAYWMSQKAKIDKDIMKYSQAGSPWMIGAGESMGQYRGAYHATRYWCKNATGCRNLEGVNITFWGRNDLDNHFISLFAGSAFIWNPFSKAELTDTDDYEIFDRAIFPIMQRWQTYFRDAFPDNISQKRGACVYNGFYWFGHKHGQPVSQSVIKAGTINQHDFLNEGN